MTSLALTCAHLPQPHLPASPTYTQVAYRGPVPTHAEYADATVKAAHAALAETGGDVTSFTLQHVPAALLSLANAAGIDSSNVSPFLADIGVGLTATGKMAKRVPPPCHPLALHHPHLSPIALTLPDTGRAPQPATLRRRCRRLSHCA